MANLKKRPYQAEPMHLQPFSLRFLQRGHAPGHLPKMVEDDLFRVILLQPSAPNRLGLLQNMELLGLANQTTVCLLPRHTQPLEIMGSGTYCDAVFSGTLLPSFLQMSPQLQQPRNLVLPADEKISAMFRRLAFLSHDKKASHAEAPAGETLENELTGLIARILSALAELTIVSETDEVFAELLRAYEYNLGTHIAVETIAQFINISTVTQRRLFRKHLNLTPQQYLQQQRVSMAKLLLQHTVLSIKEIAGKVGYTSPLIFSRAFHNVTGYSPGEFRNLQNGKKISAKSER